MAKEKLIALKRLRYGSRIYKEGESFEAGRQESQLLRLIGHAKSAPAAAASTRVVPPVTPPVAASVQRKPIVVETPVPAPKLMTTEVKVPLTDKAKHDGKEKK